MIPALEDLTANTLKGLNKLPEYVGQIKGDSTISTSSKREISNLKKLKK